MMTITDATTFLIYLPQRGRNFTFEKVYTDEGLNGLRELTWPTRLLTNTGVYASVYTQVID